MELSARPTQPHDDHELIARIRGGDVQAFETLYRLYYEPLVAFATALLHERDAAQDAVIDTLVAIWEGRERLRISGLVKSYLFSAVRNRAFNQLRASRREQARLHRAFDADDVPGMGSGDASSAEEPLDPGTAIWAAVAHLNERARTVVTLRWQEQLAFAEIAKVLETSEDAVKKVHQRAMVTLARLLPDLLS